MILVKSHVADERVGELPVWTGGPCTRLAYSSQLLHDAHNRCGFLGARHQRGPVFGMSVLGLRPVRHLLGDPPPGLSVRGAFFGRRSDKEVCGGVVSVVSESSSRRRSARVPRRPGGTPRAATRARYGTGARACLGIVNIDEARARAFS